MTSSTSRVPASTVKQKFGRAMLLRCPRCGAPGIMQQWMKMKARCPNCGLALERGEEHDFWLGAFAINLVIAEGIAAVAGVLVMWRTWPAYQPAEWTAIVFAVIMPFIFFPFSRTLWLAWDLSFRPIEEGDDQ